MEKIWLKQYQEGVPHDIDVSEHESLVALFEECCHKYRDNPAYENMGTEITYGKLNELSIDFAAYLQHLGLKKGARVAIMMPNLLQYPIALFAILRAGFIAVNTNPLYTQDELIHQMKDSGAEAIVILVNFAKTLEKAQPHLPALKHVITTQIGDVFPQPKRFIVNAIVKWVKRMVPRFSIPGAVTFHQALAQGQRYRFQAVPVSREDVAFLQYTGGTTGVAKGAMLTHGNMVANVLQAHAWIHPLKMGSSDIIITALPLYHIFSLTANCLTFFKVGAKNILVTNPRDINGFVKTLKTIPFTVITGVNTLFNALLNHPEFDDINFSRVKLALAGGMALQKSVSLKWHEKTHSRILEAYGLTETSPAATINPMYLETYNGSIGLPISSTEVSIRDDQGVELPIGEKGELCIKGPQVMLGYWHRKDETDLVFWADGFLRTGDIAAIDEEGFLYLVDRKKDMILVSGFNVYPNEVEQVINLHPGVLEAGVIGVFDNESGEKVKACVVRRDLSLTAQQITQHCRQHLTPYKVPKIIEFRTELPKTNVGKILRRALR